MANFLEVYSGVKNFYNDISGSITEIIGRKESSDNLVSDLVKNQLLHGINSDGNLLAPPYLSDPHFKNSTAAKKYKSMKDSLAEKHEARIKRWRGMFPTKPDGVPNLIVTGAFQDGIFVTFSGTKYTIDSTYSESDKIQQKYNNKVLDLTDESIVALTRIVLPELSKRLMGYIG